jgi:hypothetical protein
MLPLRSVLLQNRAVTLSEDVTTDLPVNPLLCILYTIRCEQLAVSDTADKTVSVADVLADVSKIEVLFRGSAILSGSLLDIAVMNGVMIHRWPQVENQGDATNGARAVTVPIYLGRMRNKGMECFPAVRRGELTLHRVMAATSARQVTTTIAEQVETIELLGAEPSHFLKYVTLSKTMVTTGDNDLDLPMGNPLIGALLFGTTGFTATVAVATYNKTKLLVDNVEWMYALANWESLRGGFTPYLAPNSELDAHVHTENLAAAYAADVASARPRTLQAVLDNYAFLDFDMFEDDSMLLETTGRGRVHLRVTAGTADAARCLPLERVALPGAATA